MLRSRLVRGSIIVCAVAIVSCKSDSDGGESGPTLDELGPQIAERVCQEIESCTGKALSRLAFGGADCEANLLAELEDDGFAKLAASIDAGFVDYHGENAEACLEAIGKLGCEVTTQRLDQISACDEVFVGTAAVGEDCDVDGACAGDAYCKNADQCPGACAERGGSGDDCEDDDHCKNGLQCSAGKCEKPADEGDPCGAGDAASCALGLTCNGADETTGTKGTCGTLEDAFSKAEGQACNLEAGELCEPDLSCIAKLSGVSVSFVCAALVGSGEACSFGVPTQCPDGEYCDADIAMAQVTGTCQPLPGDGDACQLTIPGSPNCAPGLVCGSEAKCRKIGRIGDACADDGDCASSHCESDKCAVNLCEP